ncbi:Sir2 family NAD-dependent protein deacetylase [Embleya sp. NPDC020630]|uniref:Sir2 family NAD-dependent protein deacetylase n=1 Tax=Embleya sp. NPDC020630 TaxID=3363979 RepID=UPI00378F4D3D
MADRDQRVEAVPASRRIEPALHGHRAPAPTTTRNLESGLDTPLRPSRPAGVDEPPCSACGKGTLRPDVVLFGEHPDRDLLGRAANAVRAAAVLLVIGTSLEVRPAADLCATAIACGVELMIVNAEPTPYDDAASTVLRGDVEVVVPRLVTALVAGGTPTR